MSAVAPLRTRLGVSSAHDGVRENFDASYIPSAPGGVNVN
jgi:hypothetical protein